LITIKERTVESITDILSFYETVGYGGGAEESDKIFLATNNETLIGSVRISIENSFPILRGMFISETFRGQSIGKKLLKKIDEYLNSLQKTSYCGMFQVLVQF